MSESEEREYRFFGQIYPERANAQLSMMKSLIGGMEAEISIHSSQVFVTVHNVGPDIGLYTLKNMVTDAVYTVTDIFSISNGYSYEVEITGVFHPDGGRTVFGVEIAVLEELADFRENLFGEVLSIYSKPEGVYLQHALADLRQAMAHPADSGFYCYRAVESVKRQLVSKRGGDPGAGWEIFRDETGATESELKYLRDEYANPRRHGDTIAISGQERKWIFATTWRVLVSYIDWFIREYGITPREIEHRGQ